MSPGGPVWSDRPHRLNRALQCHAPEPPDRAELGAVAAAAGTAAAAGDGRGLQLRPCAPPAARLPLRSW